jgi:hypothetical protein
VQNCIHIALVERIGKQQPRWCHFILIAIANSYDQLTVLAVRVPPGQEWRSRVLQHSHLLAIARRLRSARTMFPLKLPTPFTWFCAPKHWA